MYSLVDCVQCKLFLHSAPACLRWGACNLVLSSRKDVFVCCVISQAVCVVLFPRHIPRYWHPCSTSGFGGIWRFDLYMYALCKGGACIGCQLEPLRAPWAFVLLLQQVSVAVPVCTCGMAGWELGPGFIVWQMSGAAAGPPRGCHTRCSRWQQQACAALQRVLEGCSDHHHDGKL